MKSINYYKLLQKIDLLVQLFVMNVLLEVIGINIYIYIYIFIFKGYFKKNYISQYIYIYKIK